MPDFFTRIQRTVRVLEDDLDFDEDLELPDDMLQDEVDEDEAEDFLEEELETPEV